MTGPLNVHRIVDTFSIKDNCDCNNHYNHLWVFRPGLNHIVAGWWRCAGSEFGSCYKWLWVIGFEQCIDRFQSQVLVAFSHSNSFPFATALHKTACLLASIVRRFPLERHCYEPETCLDICVARKRTRPVDHYRLQRDEGLLAGWRVTSRWARELTYNTLTFIVAQFSPASLRFDDTFLRSGTYRTVVSLDMCISPQMLCLVGQVLNNGHSINRC